MARRILLHEDFVTDFRRNEDWLIRAGRDDWLVNLLAGVEEVAAVLERFPEIGRVLAQDERLILRRFPLRRYPYVVWYAHRAGRTIRDVWLVRLFGAHQDRASADPDTWRPVR